MLLSVVTARNGFSRSFIGAAALVAALSIYVPVALAQTNATPDTAIRLETDSRSAGKPLVHFWSKVVGAGRANEGLRATWQDELSTSVKAGGFQYVRFHGLFHDDMFVYREEPNGTPVYNFQYIDDLFDRMLKNGAKPFVELSFPPSEMATVLNTTFWWKVNGSPPTDNKKWAELVRHFVEHCIARYGKEEVRTWYFEVWNEPNLTKPFFRGTQQQYFELYKVTAETLKSIDPVLRVGGPATSNFHIDQDALTKAKQSGKPYDPLSIPWKPIWVADFINYCSSNNVPVDFISTHPYPQDFAIDDPGMPKGGHFRRSINSTHDDLAVLRKMVDASPFPKAEIQLTEWSSSPSPLDHSHDSLAAAAFVAKTNLESIGLVESLSYWVFTDVFEENRKTDSVFHGGFGLINYQEIVKPAFHAYRFMNQLGNETISQTEGMILTRDSQTKRITAVAYNYPVEAKISLPVTGSLEAADAIDNSGTARELSLKLTHLPRNARFKIETLDRKHGNAVAAWEAMGRPEPPTREQTEILRKSAMSTQSEFVSADANGTLNWRRPIEPWSVLLIQQQ